MYEPKKKILIYKSSIEQQILLLKRYSDKYDVEGTDCFTDILAIPAAMIVLNPEQLSLQEMEQMNEVFKYDSETIIVFTCNITPRFAGVLGSDNDSICNENMKYLVVTDLKRIDIDM